LLFFLLPDRRRFYHPAAQKLWARDATSDTVWAGNNFFWIFVNSFTDRWICWELGQKLRTSSCIENISVGANFFGTLIGGIIYLHSAECFYTFDSRINGMILNFPA
jgi:hypothetical protein